MFNIQIIKDIMVSNVAQLKCLRIFSCRSKHIGLITFFDARLKPFYPFFHIDLFMYINHYSLVYKENWSFFKVSYAISLVKNMHKNIGVSLQQMGDFYLTKLNIELSFNPLKITFCNYEMSKCERNIILNSQTFKNILFMYRNFSDCMKLLT